MQSNKQEEVKATVSRELFLTPEGEPMSFFLRPGPVKRTLQPLITAGGGLLCHVQMPGSILLISQEERATIPPSTAHWFVSIDYIYDCIEKGKQLNIADYRLNPKDTLRQSARLMGKDGLTRGRNPYTPEEDAAILSYVKKHKSEVGGNRLWQTMHKQHVTSRSWQSMKYRFKILAKKLDEEEKEEVDTTKTKKEENNEETEDQKSSTENAASPQTHSPEDPQSEMIQVDPLPTPAEASTPENVEAETSHVSQPEEPPVDLQEDVSLSPNSTDPQAAEPQTSKALPEENMPEETLQSPPCTSTPIEPKESQRVSLKLGQRPQHRRTRRQLMLGLPPSPEPYGKKLRSSNCCEKESASSQSPKKTKAAGGKHSTTDPTPSKRARGISVEAAAESEDEEPNPLPQKEDKTERTGLRILGLAIHEFEIESESSEEEAADFQTCPQVAAKQPTSTVPPLSPPDTATDDVSTQSSPESLELVLEESQQTQTLRNDNAPETDCANPQPQPAAPEPAAPEPAAPEPAAPEPAAPELAAPEPAAPELAAPEPAAAEPAAPKPVVMEAPPVVSRAHLFIFDNESQEDNSQSLLHDGAGALSRPRPAVNKDAALSLTQVQLEEDTQQIRDLMNQTQQDLVSVTKALLKTSGDVSAAHSVLLNPSAITGPLWTRADDDLLLCTDPVFRQQLQEKYGEQEMAKRIVFLELDK